MRRSTPYRTFRHAPTVEEYENTNSGEEAISCPPLDRSLPYPPKGPTRQVSARSASYHSRESMSSTAIRNGIQLSLRARSDWLQIALALAHIAMRGVAEFFARRSKSSRAKRKGSKPQNTRECPCGSSFPASEGLGSSIDLKKSAVGPEGMDRHGNFLHAARTPADVGVAGPVLMDSAINPAALEHDAEIFLFAHIALG